MHLLQACVLSRFSHAGLFAIPWPVAHQAPVSMVFSRLEYWRGLPCPPPGYLPHTGMDTKFLTSPALGGGFFITTWEACY